MEITRVGGDLAKNVFQVHGVDGRERPVWCKSLKAGEEESIPLLMIKNQSISQASTLRAVFIWTMQRCWRSKQTAEYGSVRQTISRN